MSLFPRFVSHDFPRFVQSDFAPVWRLLDDYANQVVSARNNEQSPQPRSFNPRFDVQEVEGAYELQADVPGAESKNIEIEFPDQKTIVIKGSTGYTREETTSATPVVERTVEQATPSEGSSHQATVEDEPEIVTAADATSETASVEATPEATPVSTPAPQQAQPLQKAEAAQQSRYWVSERHSGQFQRTFSFPAPVDVENTKARLHNGVLAITIPKIQVKTGVKRINIE